MFVVEDSLLLSLLTAKVMSRIEEIARSSSATSGSDRAWNIAPVNDVARGCSLIEPDLGLCWPVTWLGVSSSW